MEDYGLVKYVPLAIQDRASLEHILGLSDKANGYVFARLAEGCDVPPEMLYGSSVKVGIENEGDFSVMDTYLKALNALVMTGK